MPNTIITAEDIIEKMVAKYRERITGPGFLVTGQVAEVLDVSEATVKRWCDSGLIASARTVGGHRKITAKAVADFMNGALYQRRIHAANTQDNEGPSAP